MPHLSSAFVRHWLTRVLQWLAEPQCSDELQLHREIPRSAPYDGHKKSG